MDLGNLKTIPEPDKPRHEKTCVLHMCKKQKHRSAGHEAKSKFSHDAAHLI